MVLKLVDRARPPCFGKMYGKLLACKRKCPYRKECKELCMKN